MRKRTIIAGTTVLTISLAATGGGLAQAIESGRHKRLDSERRSALQAAVARDDYAAWATLLADHPKNGEFVNQKTFQVLVEAHRLAKSGEYGVAREPIMVEADLKLFGNKHEWPRGWHRAISQETRENIRAAIKSNDYAAWSKAMSGHPQAENIINSDAFAKMVKIHRLRQNGEREAARQVKKELYDLMHSKIST